MNSPAPAPDDALAHLGWVRALALGLARDANVAEDVVQDAYLLSLERPPRQASRLGPWLARVTRTLARQEVRSSRSRRQREGTVAQASATHPCEEPHEVLERGRRQRMVADAVLELPEPYAATVLYHYLDGLSTVEVARRMDTQPATVRKRLERARGMLRERLDEEFGGETENWALGLVLPLSQWRAPTATTGVASAGAKSLVAGSWMGSKLIGVVGVMLAAGLFVMTRGTEVPDAAAQEPVAGLENPVVASGSAEQPSSPGAASSATGARTPLPVIVIGETADSAAPAALANGEVLLLVRGLREDGSPVESGRVDCFWNRAKRVGPPTNLHHVITPITSEVTRVVLPAGANSVRVCVSNASTPPSPAITLSKLHGPLRNPVSGELTTIEVDVTLAAPLASSYAEGDIYVDGRLECPPGLRIYLNGPGYAWINTITSSYRIGPIPEDPGDLMITSDFSLPTLVELEDVPGENQRRDLRLKSGRKLIVHAVDSITGAPAAGREITIQVNNLVRTTLFRSLYHYHTQTKVADSAGNCHFQAVPTKGQVSVTQRLDDGVGQRVLKTLYLEPDMPDVVECEVQLEPTGTVLTRVFGQLPPDKEADAQSLRTIRFVSLGGGQPQSLTVGSGGEWSMELTSHQTWEAKALLAGKPNSDGKIVELRGEQEFGPVQLGYWGEQTITLHLVDVPSSGQVEIECEEVESHGKQRRRLDVRGEDIDVALQLSGVAKILITVIADGGDSELGHRQRIEVDPRTEQSRVVELGGSQALGLSLRINGEVPQGEGHVLALKPGATIEDMQRVLFPIQEGRASDPQVIGAGRWLYLVRHDDYPGLLLGWLDVPETSRKPLSINWRGALHATAELGAGLELQKLDGVEMLNWLPGWGKLPWRPEQLEEENLWLPAGLEFSVTD